MDCYILCCVLPFKWNHSFKKDYKILGLNINEREIEKFVTKKNKV